IKDNEYRAGMVPASVAELTLNGHEVLVESGLGAGIGLADEAYRAAGARVLERAEEIWDSAELIVKVKEPQPRECERLRAGQVLFTYLHLAPDEALTRCLLDSGVTAIAYETVTAGRSLPLLAPMSEVAGRLSVQAGAPWLGKDNGGRGILLGGVPGVDAAHVLSPGGGVVGGHAGHLAQGLGAQV